MILIWGSRALTKKLGDGQFYCPTCDDEDCDYTHMRSREWFTLYFLPVFPIGGPMEYIECRHCKQTYKESVLDLEPPTPAERLAKDIDDKLDRGYSVEACEEILVEDGLPKTKAKEFVEMVVGDDADELWPCSQCGEHYLAHVRKCKPCSKKSRE